MGQCCLSRHFLVALHIHDLLILTSVCIEVMKLKFCKCCVLFLRIHNNALKSLAAALFSNDFHSFAYSQDSTKFNNVSLKKVYVRYFKV